MLRPTTKSSSPGISFKSPCLSVNIHKVLDLEIFHENNIMTWSGLDTTLQLCLTRYMCRSVRMQISPSPIACGLFISLFRDEKTLIHKMISCYTRIFQSCLKWEQKSEQKKDYQTLSYYICRTGSITISWALELWYNITRNIQKLQSRGGGVVSAPRSSFHTTG